MRSHEGMEMLLIMKTLSFIGIGFFIGRVTMAVQYEYLKPKKR